MINVITNLDFKILLGIQYYLKSPFLDTIMPIITFLGNSGMLWIIVAIGLTCTKKYRHIGILCLFTLAITSFFGEIVIKNIVQRNRPFLSLENINLIIKAPHGYSFPSTHSATSFTSAAMLSHFFKKYRIGFFTLAITIAFSRLYLLVHFPSDVLVGIILGLAGYFITITIYNFLIKNKHIRFNS